MTKITGFVDFNPANYLGHDHPDADEYNTLCEECCMPMCACCCWEDAEAQEEGLKRFVEKLKASEQGWTEISEPKRIENGILQITAKCGRNTHWFNIGKQGQVTCPPVCMTCF